MSKPLIPPISEPLQFAFMQAGESNKFANGERHYKTVPSPFFAQAVEGAYEVRCNGWHAMVPSGGAFFIPAHAPVDITHWAGKHGVMAARWIVFRFNVWGIIDFLSLYDTPLQLPTDTSHKLGKIIAAVLDLQKKPGTEMEDLIARNEFAVKALRLVCGCSRVTKNPFFSSGRNFRTVVQYIQENLGNKISVEQLANITHLSPAQFYAVFKKEFGISPMRYVRNIRLDAACRQLITQDRTVSEIAGSVGFGDPFQFSHAFKTHFGLSPRAYRRQMATGLL